MNNIPELCLCCMSPLDENGECPDCGNTEEVIQASPYLPLKTVVGKRYIIGMEKKKNPEGITYAAYDMQLNTGISIREFYPDALAVRAQDNITVLPFNNQRARYIGCMNSFLSLWRSLEKLKNLPALITVYDIIEQNGTVYAVYAEPERISLRDYLLQTPDGYIPWKQAATLFAPVLETVIGLNNAGIFHRGISPSSLIVGNDGTLKLTNFGILQVRSEGSVLKPELFEGYAAYEQYNNPIQQGNCSDVYALAASLYRTLTGVMPINALSRAKEDLMMFPAFFTDIIPAYVIEGIISAMEIYPDDRTADVASLRRNLQLEPTPIVLQKPVSPSEAPPVSSPSTPAVRRPVQPSDTVRIQPTPGSNVTATPGASFPVPPAPMPQYNSPAATAPIQTNGIPQQMPAASQYRPVAAVPVQTNGIPQQMPAASQYRPVAAVPAQTNGTPQTRAQNAPKKQKAEKSASSSGKTTVLIIILVIVLLLLLVGIAVTVKGILGNMQLQPDLSISNTALNFSQIFTLV